MPPSYGDSSGPAVDEWFDGSEVRSTVDGFVWDRDAGRMAGARKVGSGSSSDPHSCAARRTKRGEVDRG